MAQTAQEYYSDKNNWGNYQYVTLKEVVDEMLVDSTDPDSYLHNTKRSRILLKAMDGIRILNREAKTTIHGIEITVPPNLQLALPEDYIDWVRVSIVEEDFRLKPLEFNTDIPLQVGAMQDSNYDLIFDTDGEVVYADSSNFYNKPHKRYIFKFNEFTIPGQFVIDQERGVIGFSKELAGKEIVLEYYSDGLASMKLKNESVRIHKNQLDVLKAYIYAECIATRRSVQVNEKTRARNRYLKLLHALKVANLNFTIDELARKMTPPRIEKH